MSCHFYHNICTLMFFHINQIIKNMLKEKEKRKKNKIHKASDVNE